MKHFEEKIQFTRIEDMLERIANKSLTHNDAKLEEYATKARKLMQHLDMNTKKEYKKIKRK